MPVRVAVQWRRPHPGHPSNPSPVTRNAERRAMSADRNLLFGILALQMDFISRDALIGAMNAWVLNKQQPLGQILVEQQALGAERRALLDALVGEHLRQHDGDAHKSLAALSPLGSVHHDLQHVADPDLHASLAHVPVTRPPAEPDDPYATRSYSVGALTSAGLRFRILRPHAKGGLGIVFVAQDEELRREVALKEIQNQHADRGDSRARFLLEAEITGGLEHPGIVPVYGLGTYDDGRPYYAMRFIRGDSLKEAIGRFHQAEVPGRDPGERALALRQLLGRFVDVCDAIAYAHSRGVLHRDLKPGNIMLGPYGETLVVDWGLAKAVGRVAAEGGGGEGPLQPASASGTAATQVGSALGTPQYMSPEQAAGRLDQLGPASDVYSLGATLYCLLSGKAPVEGREVGEVLRKVQRGEFPPPRQVKGEVPAALEAVCLKAMALRPEDRYGSARALAADVERWLADEPVSAWREPLRLRMGRWARRHQTGVAACAAGLLVAVLAGGAGAWWLDQQRSEQRQAVQATLEKVGELQEKGQWKEAEALLQRENERLGPRGPHDLKARLKRAADDMALVKRLEDIRLKRAIIVEGHMDFAGADRDYEEALQSAGLGEVGGDAAVAAAWVRNSSVHKALVAALDDWAGCVRDRQRRAWLLGVARQADPWWDGVRDPAAWEDAGVLARRVQQEQAAQQSPQLLLMVGTRLRGKEREALLKWAWEGHPEDFWINVELANALREEKKAEEAVSYYRAALAVRPGTAAIHNSLGVAMSDQGKLTEAVAEYQKAIELDPKFAIPHTNLGGALYRQGKRAEGISEFQMAIELDPKLALGHFNLGITLYDQGKLPEAIAKFRKAIELDPKLAQPHNNLGVILRDQGKLNDAVAEYQKAIELDPKYASPHNNLGGALYGQGKLAEAIAEYQRAIGLDPKSALPHNGLGMALHDQHKLAEAIAEYRKAIALDPKFALSHNGLGAALYGQGRLGEAIAEYRKAIELDPKDASIHYNFGNALYRQGEVAEAIAEFRRAIALDPKLPQPHNNLGIALHGQGKLMEAIAEYRKAIELDPKFALPHKRLSAALYDQHKVAEAIAEWRKGIELDPNDIPAHTALGDALYGQGRLREAIAEYRKAIELNPKYAPAHCGLGSALYSQHQLPEAVAEYRKAIDLDPKYAPAHTGLGAILYSQGQLREAIAEYRKAIELDPKSAPANCNLGSALYDQHNLAEAIAEYRKAIELDPKLAQAHHGLGIALHDQGKLAEAMAEFRKAIELDPRDASPHNNLGNILRDQGKLAEAIAEFRKAIELDPKLALAHRNLRRCEEILALDRKLPAILEGKTRPGDAAEQVGFAHLCQFKKRYLLAARFFADAFAAQPKLADDLQAWDRYNAACCAALAAAGQGEGGAKLDDKERGRLRQQSLGWLRADLILWDKQVQAGTPQVRAGVQKTLEHWMEDADLMGVRDAAALAKMPEVERAEWKKLWADVEALRKKAGE